MTGAPLSLPKAALDLDRAVPYDGRDAPDRYVVSTDEGRHLRISGTGLYLLRAARDGASAQDVIANLAATQNRSWSVAQVEEAHRHLVRRIDRTLSDTTRSRVGMWGKLRLVPETVVARVAALLAPVFSVPAVLVALPLAAAAMAAALGRPHHGPAGGTAILYGYLIFLAMLCAHEFGHAAAAAHGGARPRAIGFVIYLVWPAFFSDVSESWRLARRARVVVDIGGDYVQTIAAGIVATCYVATGWYPLWMAVAFSLVTSVVNLNPFFRFDGYWLLGDALGVEHPHRQGRAALSRLVRQGAGGPTDLALAVYIVLTWCMWALLAVWFAAGAYRRLFTLPTVIREVISGRAAAPTGLYDVGLAVATLVITVVLATKAGRIVASAIGRGISHRRPAVGKEG